VRAGIQVQWPKHKPNTQNTQNRKQKAKTHPARWVGKWNRGRQQPQVQCCMLYGVSIVYGSVYINHIVGVVQRLRRHPESLTLAGVRTTNNSLNPKKPR